MSGEFLPAQSLQATLNDMARRGGSRGTPALRRSSQQARVLTPKEVEIVSARYLAEHEAEQAEILAENVNRLIAQALVSGIESFREATGEVLAQNSQLTDPIHRQVTNVLTQSMINELGLLTVENLREIGSFLQELASRSLPSEEEPVVEPPREPTYELKQRKIPLWPRIRGYEETWERVD